MSETDKVAAAVIIGLAAVGVVTVAQGFVSFGRWVQSLIPHEFDQLSIPEGPRRPTHLRVFELRNIRRMPCEGRDGFDELTADVWYMDSVPPTQYLNIVFTVPSALPLDDEVGFIGNDPLNAADAQFYLTASNDAKFWGKTGDNAHLPSLTS